MSRIRQVWPRAQVAHLWANASQDSARDAGHNFYFVGPALYSYGSHFVIAYRYQRADGSAFFILNADTYSMSTTRHQYDARRAIPGYCDKVFIGGLNSNKFSGQGWRAALMREALAQAGREYAKGAETARRSGKRYGFAGEADVRIDAAVMVARAVLADKASAADDKRAARATLKTADKARAIKWSGGDNKAEKAALASLAALLVRDEMRADFNNKIERVRSLAEYATLENCSASRAEQHARDAINVADHARELANRYKFKMPRLPDLSAILTSVEPAARAERLARLESGARRNLTYAEHYAREGQDSAHMAECWARAVIEAQREAMADGTELAAWMIERAQKLLVRSHRAQRLAEYNTGAIESAIASAASFAGADRARDAAREYKRAISYHAKMCEAFADYPRHPNARGLADMLPHVEEARAYVANIAAMIERENAQTIAAWRAGERVNVPYDVGPLLRVVGQTVESSQGAIIPASACPRLWRVIEARRNGEDVSRLYGMHVGPFTLNEIREDGSAVIGCHEIAYAELRAAAAALNLENVA